MRARLSNILAKFLDGLFQIERPVALIVMGILAGCLAAFLYASQATNWAQFGSIVGVTLMIAAASMLSGGLLGFLFGIPRTLQQGYTTEGAATQSKEKLSDEQIQRISYQQNTNLEQISDWLTKILVGVGLTQITSLPGALQTYAEYTANGLGNFSNSRVFALALLIFFLISGFLASYLWTRLYLAGAFREADVAALGGKLALVESKVSELERQTELDAKALGIVQRQLNPSPDSRPIPQEEVSLVIRQATANVKAQIFYQAQSFRRDNWKDRQTKPKMERTIPIFRALISSDSEDVYHANHGQLGYALKDQRQPNWAEAESEFSKAINLRGPWQEHGWLFYEFNRAICKINLDDAYRLGKKSDDSTTQAILTDLKSATAARGMRDVILGESAISKWLEINGVDEF